MSTLGKILTVLIAVVSIAVAVLVARDFVLGEDWRAAYEEEAKRSDRALAQRNRAFQQRDKLKSQTDADMAGLQQKIETLTNELDLRKETINNLNREKVNQEKRLEELDQQLAGLNKSYENLVATRDEYRKERDDAVKRADTLLTMYTELEGKYRAAGSDLANLKESLRQAREEIKVLDGKIAYAAQEGFRWPAKMPLPPSEKLEGLVTTVDSAAGVAQINLGSDDGVVPGMKFYVFDPDAGAQGKYLATLTINRVSHDSAAGELGVVRGTVEKNNHVTNRFIE